jgi:gag-polyprotein putative aspartyl protease
MSKYLMYVVTLVLSVVVAACLTPDQSPRVTGRDTDARVAMEAEQARVATEQIKRKTEQIERKTEQIERKFGVYTPPTPTPAFPPPPPAPRPVLPNGEEIPLVKESGVYTLPVELNGVLTLNFVLDSGASEVLIPADVASTLLRTRTIQETDFLPGQTYTLADGSKLRSPRFVLRSLKIGTHQLTNITASVGTPTSSLLLGQSVLGKLGTWSINNQRQVLIIHP